MNEPASAPNSSSRPTLYLRSLGNWTANPLKGYDFQHPQRAVDFAREHGVGGVQIAVKFIEGQYDEVFPLPSNLEAPAHPVAQANPGGPRSEN